jgi:hypothetical protein
VFSIGSIPRINHEDQREKLVSLEFREKSTESLESAVSGWEIDQLEVADSRPRWRCGR